MRPFLIPNVIPNTQMEPEFDGILRTFNVYVGQAW